MERSDRSRLADHVIAAFDRVDRAAFVPDRIWVQDAPDSDDFPVDRATQPQRWEHIVYSDLPIVTQWDDGSIGWPAIGYRPTSSASSPTVIAGMLAALDVHAGHRVLEIGTGTGFNAALLAEITGKRVTSVEIDAKVAATARENLLRAGYAEKVRAVHADGMIARPGTFDRIIVTATVHIGRIPYAWVRRTVPGGLIVVPVRADMAGGPLIRFEVGSDQSARGHAVPPFVGFMDIRAHRVAAASTDYFRFDDPAATRSTTDLAPWVPLLADDHRWPIAVALPSCRYEVWERTEARPHGVAWLVDPLSRSWASVVPGDGVEFIVRQSGPRRLWDAAEHAYRWWQRRGEPPIEAWTWTVAADRQSVYLR